MLLKILSLLPHLFCNVEFEFSWFHNTKKSSENLILKIELLLELQSKTNMEILGSINDFGFNLEFRNIDLLDTYTSRYVR